MFCALINLAIYDKYTIYLLADTVSGPGDSHGPTNDQYELFVSPEVQSLLRRLTHITPKALPDYTTGSEPKEIVLLTKEELSRVGWPLIDCNLML